MSQAGSVLVTGASGFVGRVTVADLRASGWRVTCAGRKLFEAGSTEFIHLDLDDPVSIMELSKGSTYDAIVHLGARVGLSGETDSDLLMANVLSTGLLIQLASNWGARFLFTSTAIVHGAGSPRIDSNSAICADTPYARSKWLAEQLVDCLPNGGCVLRVAGIYGAAGPTHLGLNRAIENAMNGQAPTVFGNGEALRNYVYVKDVSRAIVHALAQNLDGTHLLAGTESLSMKNMLQTVCDVFLPGQQPQIVSDGGATDQVISPSSQLPDTRSFQDALVDIQTGVKS